MRVEKTHTVSPEALRSSVPGIHPRTPDSKSRFDQFQEEINRRSQDPRRDATQPDPAAFLGQYLRYSQIYKGSTSENQPKVEIADRNPSYPIPAEPDPSFATPLAQAQAPSDVDPQDIRPIRGEFAARSTHEPLRPLTQTADDGAGQNQLSWLSVYLASGSTLRVLA